MFISKIKQPIVANLVSFFLKLEMSFEISENKFDIKGNLNVGSYDNRIGETLKIEHSD